LSGKKRRVLLFLVYIYNAKGKSVKEIRGNNEQNFRLLFQRHNSVMLLIEPDSGTIVAVNDGNILRFSVSFVIPGGDELTAIETLKDAPIIDSVYIHFYNQPLFCHPFCSF
jgi:hypothetical protein